ncbi:MAG: DUF4080 domain-containing protein [Spirochaetia bacterium]|jgi:radical SAM superfamily enzyme YgiQ (UPF0313 family)|nr:DUF4080 domain-containing protein [Spirochaetia bacterium]
MQTASPLKLALVSIHIQKSSRAVPLGAAMIASSLKSALHDLVKPVLINLYLDQSVDESVNEILKTDPDCAGFSVYLWNRRQTLLIAGALKKKKPGIVIFAGGSEPTADMADIKKEGSGNIDFVLAGEGENISVDAVRKIYSGSIPKDEKALLPVNLDELPSPYLDSTLDVKLYSGLLWELSRGCPFKCDFCFESRGYDKVRMFPIHRIQEELMFFASARVSEIFVLDPTFNHNKKRAKDLLVMMHNIAPDIHFNIEIRSEYLDREMAALFSSIKCSLQIGMQSANKDVLENINRTINKMDFEKKILFLHEADVTYGFDLIYGLPGDTISGFLQSLDFALGMMPNHIDIFPLAVLPGTRLFETASALGLEYQNKDPYLVLSSPLFPVSDMRQAEEIAAAFDLFYNKGKAVPWLPLLLENLNILPSQFFPRLASWIKDNRLEVIQEYSGPKNFTEIISLQRDFITYIFTEENKGSLTRIMLDIVQFFGLCSQINEDEKEEASAWFNYSPSELIENLDKGVRDLAELPFFVPVCNAETRISYRDGQIIISQ